MSVDHVEVPTLAGGEQGDYVLRVNGDAMAGARIHDGDYIVVRKADHAAAGDIGVAQLEDEWACRFLRVDEGEVGELWLEAATDDYAPIRSIDIRVRGVVVGMFRSIP